MFRQRSSAAVAAAGLILAATGCGLTHGTESSTTTGGEPVTQTSQDSDAAGLAKLDELGKELEATIRELASPYPNFDPRLVDGPHLVSCKDIIGNDPWPQQSSIDLKVFGKDDTRQQARETADRLEQQGWAIEDLGELGGSGNQYYQARRNGFGITVGGGEGNPTSLVLSGTSPCVKRDGSLASL